MEALDATGSSDMEALDATQPEIWRHWMQLTSPEKIPKTKYGGTGCNSAWNMEALDATGEAAPPNMEALDATEIIQAIEIKWFSPKSPALSSYPLYFS
jgi:hypothetical protein